MSAALLLAILVPAAATAGLALALRMAGDVVTPALLLAAAVAWLLLVALWARWATKRILAPLAALADAVAGDADVSARDRAQGDPRLPRELARLRGAVAARLETTRNERTRELADAADALAGQRAALESATRSRARFLAAASHDLRQPLAALTLLSSALGLGESDPVRLARINHIRECVDTLDQLFTALLDLSRLDSGTMRPEPRAFPLDALFDEVSGTFRIEAEQRGLRLVLRKTEAWVHSDRIMLTRILNNLVSNALRYTAEGGVLVGARLRGDRVRIDVWDTGAGILPEVREKVFEEFFRAHDPAAPAAARGLGLGLSTVRRLAALLEVPVTLLSRPGRGTVFSVEVPLAEPVAADPEGARPDLPLDVRGLHVFVVDDEPAIVEGMRALLESWGCRVDTAGDAETLFQLARASRQPPDIVISDLQLGGPVDGIELIQMHDQLYAQKGLRPVARLLVTGAPRQECMQALADARIPALFKPVAPEQLREAIVAAIALGRATRGRPPHS